MVYNHTGVVSARLKVILHPASVVERKQLSAHLVKKMYRNMIVRSCVAYGSLLACALLIMILS